jgi:Na+-transporting NADH:ubiquinone oxidoreductase subunit C
VRRVNKNGKKIIGIAFYKHGETPGLGAEIEKPWFTNNFIGKDLYNTDNTFIGVLVAKGKARQHTSYKMYPNSIVDGISGATITSKGVENIKKKKKKKKKHIKRVKKVWQQIFFW